MRVNYSRLPIDNGNGGLRRRVSLQWRYLALLALRISPAQGGEASPTGQQPLIAIVTWGLKAESRGTIANCPQRL